MAELDKEAARRFADLVAPAGEGLENAGARSPVARHLKDEPTLTTHLRPHWLGTPGPESDKVRATFDTTLDDLALLELAVETGYLPAAALGADVREQLVQLARSPAVRKYVVDYDFVPVMYLADRLGVKEMPGRTPPAVIPGAELRFAAFVAGHRDRQADALYQEWVKFLDDFVTVGDENERVAYHDFLTTGKPPTERRAERFARLTAGLVRFVTSLADLFALLEPGEVERFGVFYAYWLAKFFGYKLDAEGYVREEFWKAGDSWAKAARESPVFAADGADFPADARPLEAVESPRAATAGTPWQADVDTLARAWETTRQFVARGAGKK